MVVNGQEIAVQNGSSLQDFLEKAGYDPQKVAVEKNRNIVPKKNFAAETLSDGDRLEIVAFVGGG